MIGFDFEYYRPSSVEEAVQLFHTLEEAGKSPIYYAGGTEVITLARWGSLNMGAVIDIKDIPECRVYEFRERDLAIGAAITLTELAERPEFPLMAVTGGRVADHTARNKITIGGNICGQIMYKEAILPLLLTDSRVTIAGRNGLRTVPVMDIFRESLVLGRGEWVVQLLTAREMLGLPFYSVKKRKLDVIDYPLLTLAALNSGGQIRAAFSGLTAFPFRSAEMEAILNDRRMGIEERIGLAVQKLPAPVMNDWIASAEYRIFVLKLTLAEMMMKLGGEPS